MWLFLFCRRPPKPKRPRPKNRPVQPGKRSETGTLWRSRPGADLGKVIKRVEIRTEECDAKKVENLKEKLLGGAQKRHHIRHVKPDEQITVVVLGGPAAPGGRVYPPHPPPPPTPKKGNLNRKGNRGWKAAGEQEDKTPYAQARRRRGRTPSNNKNQLSKTRPPPLDHLDPNPYL